MLDPINEPEIRLNNRFPLVVQASSRQDTNTLKNLVEHCLANELSEIGAVLFRGYNLSAPDFEPLVRGMTPDLMEYDYASTPRKRVGGRIYTSTEYPPELKIPLHNEMAYTKHWPSVLWFYCDVVAEIGGETPLADSRKVFRRIAPPIRKRFVEKGVMYTRTYNNGLDVPWQQVFGSDDRRVVETYCRRAGIRFEWLDNDLLKTRQVCQAVVRHPHTEEMVWFNQAHLFHVSGLRPDVRENLLLVVDEESLPRNAYYGDGTPIEDQVLDEIRAIYQELRVTFPWQRGDLLLVDNLLTAHGRSPFSGNRRILVAMA